VGGAPRLNVVSFMIAVCRVGQNHIYIRCTYVILAGTSLKSRSYTV
jgi:hypothetical protein